MVNKVAVVDATIWDIELSDARVALNESAATEKLWVSVAVYILRCLITELLTGVILTCKTWSILRDRAKKLRIPEARSPLWSCLRVRLLTDYVGNLYHWLDYLPAPPQSASLTKKLVLLFKQVIPALVPAIPDTAPSRHSYKMAPLPPPPKKLRESLQGASCMSPNLTQISTILHTPPC